MRRRLAHLGTVVGLDLSLTGPACCAVPLGWRPGDWQAVKLRQIGNEPDPDRMARIERIVHEVFAFLMMLPGPRYVAVEGYSFHSTHRAHHLGELGGVVRHRLWSSIDGMRIELQPDVPPAAWRKFLLGGNPGKGAKKIAHKALTDAGLAGDGDELDAFGVANFTLAERGGFGLILATEESSDAKARAGRRTTGTRGAAD